MADLNVSQAPLTVTATGQNKVYDGTAVAAATLSDNRVAGDVLTVSYAAATFANKNVQNGKTVSVSGITISGTDAANYTLQNTTASTTANITARSITVTATGQNKVYDGTVVAAATLSDNRVAGDALTVSYAAAAFADKNVQNGKTVSVSGITISGTDATNYTLQNTTASTTANITVRSITVTAAGNSKTYDGTDSASATPTITAGSVASGDTPDFIETYGDDNVGPSKTLTPSGAVEDGNGGNNYNVTFVTSTSGVIGAASLTVTATGQNKVYDGTAVAAVTLSDNRVAGDVLTVSYAAATFANKNVQTGKTVSVSGITISGTDAANYTLQNTTASTTANITARLITVTATGQNKVYDGTAVAAVILSDNRVAGDMLTVSYAAAAFADKNVQTGKTVSVSGITISGTDATNYTLQNTTASTTANITARSITVTAAGNSKTYDGTDSASATPTITAGSVASGDTPDFIETYGDDNVGPSKTLTPSGAVEDGNGGNNYNVTFVTSTSGVIGAASLTVTATGQNKVYDGTAVAAATLSDNRVAGDVFTVSYAAAAFADKDVQNGKTVSVSGITISGTDTADYTLQNTTASTTANITARSITVTAAGNSKTYDGTDSASATPTITVGSVVGGDTAAFIETYGDENVGTSEDADTLGAVEDGNDGNNYNVTFVTSTSGVIGAASLTVTATGQNKVYDGTAVAAATLSDNRVAGDVLTVSYAAAAFADKNVQNGKTVSMSGITISGTDATNYTLQNTTASATADITARSITVTATGQNKVYDGTAVATATLSDNRVAGDVLTVSYAVAAFANKNVQTGKTVSVSGITISGTDATNYTLQNTTASTTADITARSITVTATGQNKVYDGTAVAAVTLSDNRVAGDVLTVSYAAATFADKDVQTGKAVTVSGITISGTDATNYTLQNTTASTTADITARSITVTAAANSKTYDGTASASATPTITAGSVVGDDTPDFIETYDEETVGTSKTLTPSGAVEDGNNGNDYNVTFVTSASGVIVAALLTVTASDASKYYGDADPTFSVSYAGFVGIDGWEDLSGTVAFTTTEPAAGNAPVTTYQITPSGLTSSNYAITFADGTLTVSPVSLTVTANDASKNYGDPDPAFSASYAGFVGGEGPGVLGGTLAFATSETDPLTSPVGTYDITPSGLTSGNYAIYFASGTLTVFGTAGSTNTVGFSSGPSNFGDALTLSATVSAADGSSGTPTGFVDFYDTSTSTDLGDAELVGGAASISTSDLGVGDHEVTVTYGGDTYFVGSGSSIQQLVNDNTSTMLVSSTSGTSATTPSIYGDLVTFTATVGAAGGFSGTPTGSVDFYGYDATTRQGQNLGSCAGCERRRKRLGHQPGRGRRLYHRELQRRR